MRTKLAPVHHASHLLNLVALVALLGVVLPLIVIDDLGQTRGVAVRLKERGVERGATEQLAPCLERKEEGWWWKKKAHCLPWRSDCTPGGRRGCT